MNINKQQHLGYTDIERTVLNIRRQDYRGGSLGDGRELPSGVQGQSPGRSL